MFTIQCACLFLRSLLVFPTRRDSFTTAGLQLSSFLTSWTALHRPPTFSSSASLTLSETVSSPHSHTPEEETISSLSQPDSGAYYKPKDLIFYNRLHCRSRRGSSYFCLNSPQLEEGASCVGTVTSIKITKYKHHMATLLNQSKLQ